MRNIKIFNENWNFIKMAEGIESIKADMGDAINLPHTWNNIDGQDGGNDYYRGTCYYTKSFTYGDLQEGRELWIEFRGVAMTAMVYLNGTHLFIHEGGYSTFRVNLTEALKEYNTLIVAVDNSKNRRVYPQKADFTFYGGIYRDVFLMDVPKEHFSLGYFGSNPLKVTPVIEGTKALVKLETWTENLKDGTKVNFSIDGVGSSTALIRDNYGVAEIEIEQVHLWNGLEDPYLYRAVAAIEEDEIETTFGCRNIEFSGEKGFLLNGRPYPLCGAARHQDREGVGNAISKEMMEEDMEIMKDMGVNTIRLAHYQHDQYFYDLCDKEGIVVWVEIPYITEHMPEGRENTLSQMRELIVQNYNHPSIVCWGLSNEITASGGLNEDLMENHRLLNDLCHSLDNTRPTTMAHAFMLDTTEKLVSLPDIGGYNLYFGWYLGDIESNDKWFDDFHRDHPEIPICLSEYGADANPQYQSATPEKGDWTEGYQAIYHEHLLKMWSQRPYIWSMYCWNMFDFGADGRNEGGKPGQNQKGLVTFDRKLKKDAFYIYKAYLSKEPFIHVCGRRYVDRVEEVTEVKVYSNVDEVTLWVDGEIFEKKKGNKVFTFKVPISATHEIKAQSGNLEDSIKVNKVKKANGDYVYGGEAVVNWFDKPEEMIREGFYSIFDVISDIKKSPEAAKVWNDVIESTRKSYGEVAQNVEMPEAMQKLIDSMTCEKLMKQAQNSFTVERVKEINHALNQIPKIK